MRMKNFKIHLRDLIVNNDYIPLHIGNLQTSSLIAKWNIELLHKRAQSTQSSFIEIFEV